MSRIRVLLLAIAAGAAAAMLPIAGASPASAATCAPDPYNGVCVTPVTYTVNTGGTSSLAVQRTPKTGNNLRSVANGSPQGVVCQINDGGTAAGRTAHTWAAISGGGWIYYSYLGLTLDSNGWAANLRHCGTAATTITALDPTTYPWPGTTSWILDGHGYYESECVSFAAWAVRSDGRAHTKLVDWMGNAYQWTGAYVDGAPHAGDVAQWDANYGGAGSAGHVSYVLGVNSDGSVNVAEYNWGSFHQLNRRTMAASSPSRYLHF